MNMTAAGTKRLENLHIAVWLLKDYSWCATTRWLGLLMVIPTIGLAIHLAYQTRRDAEDFIHNLAVVCWLAANVTWMTGEFYFNDGTRPFARGFFYAGLGLLALHYGWGALAALKRRFGAVRPTP
jgi:hypothetical protein